eukprot:TRINITY_DN15348_c0_g1_i1.p1 TRINITY_DN15348_c0_g1~~TRINITY_DN15348_c0_g1_i1.p1  ORF type:complete len:725 (-),score=101.33 TRINITY_DN15348_c0_g1_i1:65-2173(-)
MFAERYLARYILAHGLRSQIPSLAAELYADCIADDAGRYHPAIIDSGLAFDVLHELVEVLLQQRRYADALEHLNPFASAEHPGVMHDMARCYLLTGDYEAVYRATARMREFDKAVFCAMAEQLEGRHSAAWEMLEAFPRQELDDRRKFVLYGQLGHAYLGSGFTEEDGDAETAYRSEAEVALRMGQTEQLLAAAHLAACFVVGERFDKALELHRLYSDYPSELRASDRGRQLGFALEIAAAAHDQDQTLGVILEDLARLWVPHCDPPFGGTRPLARYEYLEPNILFELVCVKGAERVLGGLEILLEGRGLVVDALVVSDARRATFTVERIGQANSQSPQPFAAAEFLRCARKHTASFLIYTVPDPQKPYFGAWTITLHSGLEWHRLDPSLISELSIITSSYQGYGTARKRTIDLDQIYAPSDDDLARLAHCLLPAKIRDALRLDDGGATALPVVVVPDTLVWPVPFAALGLPNGTRFGAHRPLVHAPSIRNFSLIRDKIPLTNTLISRPLVIGNCTSDLFHAEREALAVAEVLQVPASRVLIGNQATVAAVCSALPQTTLLHAACHGGTHSIDSDRTTTKLFLADGPLLANSFPEQQRPLSILAVLSACDTFGHHGSTWMGVVGLPMGILTLGYRAVVCARWPVDDSHTAELMKDFYAALKASQADLQAYPCARALQAAAQQAVKRNVPWHVWGQFLVFGAL